MDTLKKLVSQFELGNSRFRGQWRISKEMLHHNQIPEAEVKAMAVREMVIQLADKIMKEHPRAIVEDTGDDYNTMKVELLVLEMKQFKNIVEAAIGLLSDEQITMIRNGIEVIK